MLTLYISTNNENTKHVPRGSGINSIIAYYLIFQKFKSLWMELTIIIKNYHL